MVGNLSKIFKEAANNKAAALTIATWMTFWCLVAGNLFYDLFNGKNFEDARKNNIITKINTLVGDECYYTIKRRLTPEIEGNKFPTIKEKDKSGFTDSKQCFAKDDRYSIPDKLAESDYNWITKIYVGHSELTSPAPPPSGNTPSGNGQQNDGQKILKYQRSGTSFFINPPFEIPEGTALQVTAAHVVVSSKDIVVVYKDPRQNHETTLGLEAVHKWINPKFTPEDNNDENAKNDIALLLVQIPERLKIDKADPVLISNADLPEELNVFGFPYDRKSLTAHFKCKVQNSSKALFGYMNTYCDAASGESGGPATSKDNYKKVLGVNSTIGVEKNIHALLSNSILSNQAEFEKWIKEYEDTIKQEKANTPALPQVKNDMS